MARASSWLPTTPRPRNLRPASCTWTRVRCWKPALWRKPSRSTHEVLPADLDNTLAQEDPYGIHAAVGSHRIFAVRRARNGGLRLLESEQRRNGRRQADHDQQVFDRAVAAICGCAAGALGARRGRGHMDHLVRRLLSGVE